MKIINIGFRILLSIFAFCGVIYAQDKSVVFWTHSGEIKLSVPGEEGWKEIYYSSAGVSRRLFSEEGAYFDADTELDFSSGKEYLKVNKILRGVVGVEDVQYNYERYYCIFIEMSSGCVVRQETGSFCGGVWDETENSWLWSGEKITIDERNPDEPFSNDDIDYFSEIGGFENVSRCTQGR